MMREHGQQTMAMPIDPVGFLLVDDERAVELIHLEEDASGRRALVELDDGTRLLVRPETLRAASPRAGTMTL